MKSGLKERRNEKTKIRFFFFSTCFTFFCCYSFLTVSLSLEVLRKRGVPQKRGGGREVMEQEGS